MTHTIQLTEPVKFDREDCVTCGVVFFVPSSFQQQRRSNGGTFYCPSGHWMVYREGDADRLRKELDAAKKRTEWFENNAKAEREAREATERRLIAQRGQNTRLRKRVGNGVCPCCTRTFVNLKQHMTTQHPDFKAGEE